jgi:chromate transporter
MGAFSFLLHYIDKRSLQTDLFKFIPAMAIGFLAFASVVAFQTAIKNTITWCIMLACAVATYLLFRSPWIFPALMLLGGIATNFSQKRIRNRSKRQKK